ncbi:MAG: ATP-binding protein [Gammaproteobacteria bacterium]
MKLKHWVKLIESDLEKLSPSESDVVIKHLQTASQIELAERHSEIIQRRVASAKFIRTQTLDQYDFDYNPSTRKIKPTLLKLNQEAKQGKVPKAVLVGSTGLGKTHLARALGYTTCQSGNYVLFAKASTIVNSLASAKATNTLEKEIRRYRKPQLLIIDELGYVTMDLEAGNLFFQVISDRHDRGLGTIVTTNFAFGNWNQIFASESTAVVTVERLTAEAEVFYLEGESYTQYQKRRKK